MKSTTFEINICLKDIPTYKKHIFVEAYLVYGLVLILVHRKITAKDLKKSCSFLYMYIKIHEKAFFMCYK